jgi:hypothetical protein
MAMLPIFIGPVAIALLLFLSVGVLARLFPCAPLDTHKKNR